MDYFDPKRLHTINIKWSYPRNYDRGLNGFEEHPEAMAKGIYCISRVWGDAERDVIYIGKTERTFRKRLLEHIFKDHSLWTTKRGMFRIRIGSLEEESLCRFEDFHALVDNIESALIYEMQPECNTDKTKKYRQPLYDLKIQNSGFRGKLPKQIINREHH